MEYNDFVVMIDQQLQIKAEERLPHGAVNPVNGPLESFQDSKLLKQRKQIIEAITSMIYQEDDQQDLIKQFGRNLFDELFKGSIRNSFRNALNVARDARPPRGLRIRLQLPSELQMLPWELMFRADEEAEHFLCRNPAITLVRSKRTVGRAAALPISLPLMILVIIATPLNHIPLDTRKEIDHLLSSLATLIREGKVQIDFVHGADTLKKIRSRLQNQNYHILHLIGHGEKEGDTIYLVLEDQYRQAHRITPENLYFALQVVSLPRLVFLNMCQGAVASAKFPITSIAESFLRADIPAVIAHQFEISDDAASTIAKHLYEKLSEGSPVEEALALARFEAALQLPSPIESFTPVLFLYYETGHLFSVNLTSPLLSPQCDRLMEEARSAINAQRWSEATDYVQEILVIKPDDGEVKELHSQTLKEERLDIFLHEASFLERMAAERSHLAERLNYLRGAVDWYEKYLSHPFAANRPSFELKRIAQLKQTAQTELDRLILFERLKQQVPQVVVGVSDPWLKWRG
ncbi:MAG: CHAT domain-containing protein [Acidobacteriota bacterium]